MKLLWRGRVLARRKVRKILRTRRYESRDSDIADLVRISVEEYLSKVTEQQYLSLPQQPPPPPPQQSVTSPPAKASISSSPAKAITIVAQASDVDFVTVSPSKDPAVGRGRSLKFKDTKKEAAELKRKKTAENKARLAEERKEAADLKKKLKAEIKQEPLSGNLKICLCGNLKIF
ncbi:hypothetical protein Bca101_043844 [Brassica carinata]